MPSSTTTTTAGLLRRAGGPISHLQLSAAARSEPPVVGLIRRRSSTHLRSHDTAPALHYLCKAEARRAISQTLYPRGALRRSIHGETVIHEGTAERPERMEAQIRGFETLLTSL